MWKMAGLNSRTDKQKVTLREMILGYFLGPLLVLAMTSVVASYYLTFYRTYEDIVNQRVFLTMLPLISVIPMALSNIIIGILVGKTKTKQGKARPYILMAAPLLLVSGILVFCIPYLSLGVRMVWMAVTYNLFAAIANPIYGTSHYLMVSLSTRDLDQRGKLSVVSNIPAVAGNGLISSIVMPLILGWINSAGSNDVLQNRWQMVMTVFAVLAFVGCILEYFFTKERITEEDMEPEGEETYNSSTQNVKTDKARNDKQECPGYEEKNYEVKEKYTGQGCGEKYEGGNAWTDGTENVSPRTTIAKTTAPSTLEQLKAAASDSYWWIIIIFYLLYQAGVMFKGGYVFNIFCHEFFQEVHIFGMTLTADMAQSVLALISGIPLAAGMLFIWPLANRFGKKNMILAGCVISIVGSVVCLLAPDNFVIMLIGQSLKGLSSVPGAYIMMALFADVLDHLEAKLGYRVDGISMSVYNTVLTVVNGLAVAVFNFFYDNPALAGKAVTAFFFLGFEILAHGILIIVVSFLNVEKNIKAEQELIAKRKGQL